MTVNMAYVPFPESGTKVLKMTPPWNGSVDNALTTKKQKATAFLKCLKCLDGLLLGVVVRRKTLSSYNIFKANDHGKCQVSS